MVSVCEVPHQYNPVSVLTLKDGIVAPFLADAPPLTRRQEKPLVYSRNGPAILVAKCKNLLAGVLYPNPTYGFLMDEISSIDIDTEYDLRLAEHLLYQSRAVSNDNSVGRK